MTMQTHRLLRPLVAAALLAGCTDLDLTNPNQATSETFWTTARNAEAGLTSVYGWVQQNGTYGRWLPFVYDFRSDNSFSLSPWGDLANVAKFTFQSYDFEVNSAIWFDHYNTIYRANQVIANVPSIDMDPTRRAEIVGEAEFLRGLMYFNLAVLYANVPIITEPATPEDRPEQGTQEQVWAQVEQDFSEAAAVLPLVPQQTGRATRGSAMAMLGKAHLQQREWSEAAQALKQVIDSGQYELLDDYEDLFDADSDNTRESVFEVQFAGEEALPQGIRGQNMGRLFGPCDVGFCDAMPTLWYFEQFMKEPTVSGEPDPRLSVTMFWNDPNGMDVFGRSFAQRYEESWGKRFPQIPVDEMFFWKKYTDYWAPFQSWDSPTNVKVVRYADVLLMYAEALNEMGQTAQAIPYLDRVRQRADLAPYGGPVSQSAVRDEILHQRLLEFGMELQRWLDLRRHNLLEPHYLPELISHDSEFEFFVDGKSELLPIPQAEVNLNPNVSQNPGW